jgi:hypothetical protein
MPTAFSMTTRDQMYCSRLSSLPDKDALFALGVDRPLYFSVHSAYAELAPKSGALIHVAKYLGTSIEPKPREDQPELEEFLDLLQPGWRQDHCGHLCGPASFTRLLVIFCESRVIHN